MSTVTDKILNNIKYALAQFDNIENVEYNENDKHFYVYYKNKEALFGPESNENTYRDAISKVLEKDNLEIGGCGTISNWDNYKAAEAEFLKDHPKPVDPRYNYKDYEVYSLFSPSVKNPKNKKAREILEKYKNESVAWASLANETLPPRYTPGFRFDIQALGENQKVFDFYKDTKYWGD